MVVSIIDSGALTYDTVCSVLSRSLVGSYLKIIVQGLILKRVRLYSLSNSF